MYAITGWTRNGKHKKKEHKYRACCISQHALKISIASKLCEPNKLQVIFPVCTVPIKPPLVRGKRSAVAVVNDSPVDCQSRDGVARRQLAKIFDF